jgi:phenylalanyl-tRNA synthetase alpha chain
MRPIHELQPWLEDEENRLRSRLREAQTLQEIQEIRAAFLGKKGVLTAELKALRARSPEERREAGRLLNQYKVRWEQLIRERRAELEAQAASSFDPTLPGRPYRLGYDHPLWLTLEEILDIFVAMGFEEVVGPLVEWERYNFEALNIPRHHPARDMQSSFFITDRMLLRTHTSPVQIRVMESRKPPLRVVSPGRVFRVDEFDPTHAPAFFQMEGLYVDREVSFAHLKGTLVRFLRRFFGENVEVRFLPSYFPFTEPSAEVAIRWKGEWLEVLGCGMVHPHVFEAVGLDPETWTGYAFGLGIDRFAMIRYEIPDIRLFYQGDLRFLRQFR